MPHTQPCIRTRITPEHEGWAQAWARTLPAVFDTLGTTIHAARNVLKRMPTNVPETEAPHEVVVKRYHGLFLFQRLFYTFCRAPKCRRAYQNTMELRRRGIAAAGEVACVEVWSGGLFCRGFYVSEVVEGMRLDILAGLLLRMEEPEAARDLVRQFAAFVWKMHGRGILYRDLNCGNVLCRQATPSAPWDFCLIDTNRARFSDEAQPLTLRACRPDLMQVNLSRELMEVFLAEYLRLRGLYAEDVFRRFLALHARHQGRRQAFKGRTAGLRRALYGWLGR